MVCFVLSILSVPVWAFSGFINLHPLAGLCPLPSRSSGVFQYQSLLCMFGFSGEMVWGDPFSAPSGSPSHHSHNLLRVFGSASLFSSLPNLRRACQVSVTGMENAVG